MIAASEPLEFVPHGRTVIAKHPGKIYSKAHNSSASENSLLYKLTNFAIRDESLLDSLETEELESWSIREVSYRSNEDIDDDSLPSPKDVRDEYMSDSFRTPSGLKADFNISIKSEVFRGKKMDSDGINSAGTSRGGSANSSSNMSKKFNLNNIDQNSNPRGKPYNPKTDCSYEEELYVKGCTAVWSKGLISTPGTKLSGPEHRETISCYTIENPIKHATFCDFHIAINNTMLIDALNSQICDEKKNIKIEDTTEHLPTQIMPSILLIDNKCMRVFAADGREYITSIPFTIKRVWPMKYGVLIEKEATPLIHNSLLPFSLLKVNESNNSTFSRSKSNIPFNMSAKLRAESLSGYEQEVPLPTCFSLSHPLDEVTPILMKSPSHGLQYYNDGDLQIIFVSTNPSIILLYDWKLATHSLWKIRKSVREECLAMCPNMNSTTTIFSQSCDFIGSPMHSNTKNATSWATGAGSPFQSRKCNGTPTRSGVNSPMANIFHQQGMSPHASIGQASSISMTGTNINQSPPSLPLYPEICLDHIWMDSQTIRRDPIESSDDFKTFLHTDLVGHDYLCFLVKVGGVSRLQIMRLQKSHSHGSCSKTNLIVGSVSSILAKDAVVLEHLKMIALIDESGNIILQSGNCIVGKVHAGGVLARLLDARALPSPFPRRSSLLPAPAAAPSPSPSPSPLDEAALHLLSPVPHAYHSYHGHARPDRTSPGLRGLCDSAGSRMTLKFDGGMMYRISLPDVACSNLVTRCCTALKSILPKDITMQVLIKWYGVRNAPGTQDLTPEQEWSMFSNLLFSLIGYDVERLTITNQNDDQSEHAGVATKKQRTSSDGTQDDWEYLLNSKLHKSLSSSLASVLMLPVQNVEKHRSERQTSQESEKSSQFNTNCLLFPYVLQILYAFHLTYEEIKLNTLLYNDLEPLATFLYQLAKDLKLDTYVNYYWLDFPTELNLEYDESDSQMTEEVLKKLTQPSYFSNEPPNVFSYFNSMLKDEDVGYYPYLADVNEMSKDLIEVMACGEESGGSGGGCGGGCRGGVQSVSRRGVAAGGEARPPHRAAPPRPPHDAPHFTAAALMAHRGISERVLRLVPAGVQLYVSGVRARCRGAPPADWPPAAHRLVLRPDLARQAEVARAAARQPHCMEAVALDVFEKETAYTTMSKPEEETTSSKVDDNDTTTGMEHLDTKLLKLLYPRDHRMSEVFNLLQSSIPVTINLTQRPEVSDHDFIEEQEKHLYAISTRTMALPVARGMVTLRTLACSPTEPLCLPRLCVSGRGPPPRCNTVTLGGGAADGPPHCLLWPSFHNGVAAGLALVPAAGANIDSSWVVYNKPRGATEMSTEHAGFLMALGLNGHLRDMPFMNMYEYLVKCNEMISVGLLLGLAATYRGTMDVQATKMMSIHLEPLLPPTAVELDIQHSILVAAVLGVGLLYQGTHHAHYAHVLLNEIGKPLGGETESCGEREGYSLAAGLALGLVCAGGRPAGLAPRLRALLWGDTHHHPHHPHHHHHPHHPHLAPHATAAPHAPPHGAGAGAWWGGGGGGGGGCNADVTAPGATLALGLAWWRAGPAAPPAAWLRAPASPYELDAVRPDLLMLRVIARGLIIWDSIEPTEEWIDSEVPDTIKPYVFVKPTEEHIDYEAMNQAYCNIVGGLCFALGLRFAGSGLEEARDVCLGHARRFLALAASPAAELAGRAALEACVCVCLLAAGMVMCGRGDVATLRLCRRLRARLPTQQPPARAHAPHAALHAAPPLTHGGQMAVHCTIGLLFLGGGRATLGTSSTAVAALLAAFFPKFPTHSEDNRYHLQAFRHLYVLAVEPRLILPRDIDSGKLCYTHIQVVDLEGAVKEMMAPCLLPGLDSLREVRVTDPRYWPITFHRDRNWDQLKVFLRHTWCVDVSRRAGCLPHAADPRGFLTMLAQTLTLDRSGAWALPRDALAPTADRPVRDLLAHYRLVDDTKSDNICADCLVLCPRRRADAARRSCVCRRAGGGGAGWGGGAGAARLAAAAGRAARSDALCALPAAAALLQIVNTMSTSPRSCDVWQIKLLSSQMENHARKSLQEMTVDGQEESEPLVSAEFALSLKQAAGAALDSCLLKMTPFLRKYLGAPSSRKIASCDDRMKRMLSAYLLYHDLPRDVLKNVTGNDELAVMMELQSVGVSADVIGEIQSLLR